MANPATLRSLKDRALDYADMTGSGFPDESRLADYINSGLSELYDMLINAYEDYARKKTTIALTAGTEDYDLPSDFLKSRKLYYLSNGRRFNLRQYHLGEVSGYRTSPIFGGSVELWYIPQYAPLLSDEETISNVFPVGWEDFAALNAAVRLSIREESDPSALIQEREIQRQRIIESAEPRDVGESGAVADYYGRYNSAYQYFGFEERYFKYHILGQKISFIEFEYLGV